MTGIMAQRLIFLRHFLWFILLSPYADILTQKWAMICFIPTKVAFKCIAFDLLIQGFLSANLGPSLAVLTEGLVIFCCLHMLPSTSFAVY